MIFWKQYRFFLFISLVLGLSIGCSKMDDWKKYVADGEISYTGKLDSLRIFSGKNRVQVEGLFISDPKVTECRIFWNDRRDSISVPVERTPDIDTLQVILENMAENVYNFEVVTYDALGNPSITVHSIGTVYGDRYQTSLFDRPLSRRDLTTYSGVFLGTLGSVDLSSGIFATEIKYTDQGNREKVLRIPIDEKEFKLDDVNADYPMLSRSLFLPDSTCLDTFYTTFVEIQPDYVFYRNLGYPFTATNTSGRWGVLEHWESNAAANAIGGRGSWDNNTNVGVLSAEAGWGTPNINNGKIYQTTTLPAGEYEVIIQFTRNNVTADVNDTNNLIYFVAMDNGHIPDVTNVESVSTLGYYNLKWIADGYQTVRFRFDNPSNQEVTIGFVSNLTSSSNQFFNVRGLSVSLIYD